MYKNTINNQKGFSLIAALIVLMLIGSTVVTVASLTSTDIKSSENSNKQTKAHFAGNAALQKALKILQNGSSPVAKNFVVDGVNINLYTDVNASRILAVAEHNGVKTTQSINADFSKDCIDLVVETAYAENNLLKNIKLKKFCNKAAKLSKLFYTWNMSSCSTSTQCDGSIGTPTSGDTSIPPAGKIWICHHPTDDPADAYTITVSPYDWNAYKNRAGNFIGRCNQSQEERPPHGQIWICHYPPGNPENRETLTIDPNGWRGHEGHDLDFIGKCEDLDQDPSSITCTSSIESEQALATCNEDDGGLVFEKSIFDTNVIYQAGAVPEASTPTVLSGSTIDIINQSIENNGYSVLDAELSGDIPEGAWFVVSAEFEDGSILSKEFKIGTEGGAEVTVVATNGIEEIDNGVITFSAGFEVAFDALGSAITCGVDGPEVNVTAEVCKNSTCSDLYNGNDIDGGETYTAPSETDEVDYKIRAHAFLDSCANFSRIVESTNTIQVKTLRHGDAVPALSGFGGQMPVQTFLANYIDGNGRMDLYSNQIIMLFELGINLGVDPDNQNADFQDFVLLITTTEIQE